MLLLTWFMLLATAAGWHGMAQEADTLKKKRKDTVSALFKRNANRLDTIKLTRENQLIDYLDEYIYKTSREKRSRDFYDSLRVLLKKQKLTSRLSPLLFNGQKKNNGSKFKRSEKKFEAFEGKIISDIHLRKLRIFGENIRNTDKKIVKWMLKAGNMLHVDTRNFIIRNNLIFEKGHRINPYVFSDNERILRQLNFINDADIEVIPHANSDSADVFVITRDVWSIGAGFEPSSIYRFNTEVYDLNMLGLGQELSNEFETNFRSDHPLTYTAAYKISNLGGTFLESKLLYRTSYTDKAMEFQIERKPLLQNLNYLGGVRAGEYKQRQKFLVNHEKQLLHYNYRYYDAWLGRNFILGQDRRNSLLLSGGVEHYDYWNRSNYLANFNTYQDRKLYLLSGAFSEIRYFTTTNVFGYGRTEDVPYGYTFRGTGGYQVLEYSRRHYMGASITYANSTKRGAYAFGSLNAGGFISQGQIDEGVARLKTFYLTPIMNAGRYKFRHFIFGQSTLGINRSELDSISLNGEWGIRDFKSNYTYGKSRITLKVESVAFTPWFFYGFRFAMFGFFDAGIISSHHSFSNSSFFSGFGLGVRFGNKHLAVENIQLRVGFYPNAPKDEGFMQWRLNNAPMDFNTNDFEMNPNKINYE